MKKLIAWIEDYPDRIFAVAGFGLLLIVGLIVIGWAALLAW